MSNKNPLWWEEVQKISPIAQNPVAMQDINQKALERLKAQAPTVTPSQPPTVTPSQPPTVTPSQPPTVTPSQPPTVTPSATTPNFDTILGGTQYNANKALSDDYRKQYDNHTFNFNGNALYNQYKGNYEKQAKMGMEDAMGRAAALTGGYGNSYVMSAGQQAYYNQMDKLNDRMLDLYKIAYGQYSDEKSDLLDKAKYYGGLAQQDYDNALKLFKLNSADEAPVSLEGLERIEEELKSAKTNAQQKEILDRYYAANQITQEQGDALGTLYAIDESEYLNPDGSYNYLKMMAHPELWEGISKGEWWQLDWNGDGVNKYATIRSPFMEEMTVNDLVDAVMRQKGGSYNKAMAAIAELQKALGVTK